MSPCEYSGDFHIALDVHCCRQGLLEPSYLFTLLSQLTILKLTFWKHVLVMFECLLISFRSITSLYMVSSVI
jgi:hypothetical protein